MSVEQREFCKSLVEATRAGDVGMVTEMLDGNADWVWLDEGLWQDGITPLHIACLRGDMDMVEILLRFKPR